MPQRDAVSMTLNAWVRYLTDAQPCFYGCGILLPADCAPESTQRRRDHYEHECPNCKPIVKRAAALINQNHVQPIAEEV